MICIAGRNTLAVNCMNYLINSYNYERGEIIAVCSKFDHGVDRFEPSFRKFCIDNGIKIFELEEIYNYNNVYFFSLQYDRILKPAKFNSKSLFNIHFSLLPEFKGMYPSILPILFGKNYSGVTLHFIDDGIDTGDIIDQIKFDIEICDTSKDLYYKYMNYGKELFEKNLDLILSEKFTYIKQDNLNSSYFSKKSIDFNNLEIDLNKTSFQIHNQIRAFIFEEYQLPSINGKKIIKSFLTDIKIERNQLYYDDNKMILSGIDGYKIILDLK